MQIDEEKYIPVEVINQSKQEIWYMDISNLSLHELISLKKEILGISQKSVRALDYIICNQVDFNHTTYKERKAEIKRELMLKRKPRKKYHR